MQKAAGLGFDLKRAIDRGEVEILWQPQGEHLLDFLAHHLLDAVARRGVRRLFLDGLGALMEASIEPTRTGRFFSALVNELRARGVTMLYTMETHDVIGHGLQVPISGVSSIVESLIALRYLESHSRARRLLSVLKVRHSAFDPTLREFVINSGSGISILGAFETEEDLLSGIARDRRVRNRPSSDVED